MKKPVDKIKMCASNERQTYNPKEKLDRAALKRAGLNNSICNPIPINGLIKRPYCYAAKYTPENIIVNLISEFKFFVILSHFLFKKFKVISLHLEYVKI